MDRRPILYLDIDDTLLTYRTGRPEPAPGAREFLLWALETCEVRWLTKWCPDGEMGAGLLGDLCKMIRIESELVQHIRGFDWQSSDSKLNGIAWVEHVILGRPFLWVEDEYGVGEPELDILAEHGFLDCYFHCNVTEDEEALLRLLAALERKLGSEAGQSLPVERSMLSSLSAG